MRSFLWTRSRSEKRGGVLCVCGGCFLLFLALARGAAQAGLGAAQGRVCDLVGARGGGDADGGESVGGGAGGAGWLTPLFPSGHSSLFSPLLSSDHAADPRLCLRRPDGWPTGRPPHPFPEARGLPVRGWVARASRKKNKSAALALSRAHAWPRSRLAHTLPISPSHSTAPSAPPPRRRMATRSRLRRPRATAPFTTTSGR
jgi:hypothetical protein